MWKTIRQYQLHQHGETYQRRDNRDQQTCHHRREQVAIQRVLAIAEPSAGDTTEELLLIAQLVEALPFAAAIIHFQIYRVGAEIGVDHHVSGIGVALARVLRHGTQQS
jgi:hypothetical protein